MAGAPGTGAATGNNYYQQSNQAYGNRGYPQTGAGAQTAAAAAAAASSNPDLLAGSGANSTVGQFQPPGIRPRVTTTMWEDEKTLCYQVDANNVSVVRRADNNMINGTKLLNVAQMTRGRRDGILKSEKVRHVVKIGSMHLKGVWIPFERALSMAQREGIVDLLYPLFVRDIKRVIQTGVTPAAASAATGGAQQTSPPVNNKMGAGAVQQNYYSQYNQQQQQQQPQQPQQQYGQQYPTGTPNQGQASIVTPGPTNQQSPQQQNPAVNDPQYQQVYGGYQQQYYNGAIATPNNPNNQYYQGYYNGSTYGQQQAYPYGYQQVQQGIPQQQQQQQQPMRQQQPLQQHPHQVGDSQTNAQQHTQPPQQVQKSPGKSPPTSDKKEKK
ncbi:uncharacterized protein SPAPADRAFT_59209 [Spathaspora passalidarum NRRL Y-27907]|uniref:HTH APSES-type domain-containing protein n=1 Tax=Spathaspora passalidarum (strain NRRL Y-27907 / 11-Y1) TaxID=619300 RepID=G3AJ90_SPAPN|nr:uncharacterized protein SPAPADRAFT_59209 [Spathaspora passalidarum NRRL Y-27907]EGW33847.1 hypothetical protein SPAPADRAFT_59209 [Spathaspora passalidarum NRRL Y-27907]